MGSEPLFPLHHRWEVMPLGEVCRRGGGNVQTGPFGSQLHASDYVSDGIPSVMPQNIGDNKILYTGIAKITREDAERLSKYRMREGDIVYSRRGDVERRALVRKTEDGWLCGTGCLRIRFGDEFVYPRYAAHYLGHPSVREWIVRHAHGATMPNLNTTILSELPFVLPPWSAQVLIGDAIEAYDRKLDLNRRINQTLEAIAQAIFQSWFVDFEPVKAKIAARAEGRDPLRAAMSAVSGKADAELDALPPEQYEQLAATAVLFPDEMEESELGEIPKGCIAGSLGDICNFTAGSAFSPEHQGSAGGDYPFIKVSDMNLVGNEVFIQSANNYVSQARKLEMKAKLHPQGATVFAKIGVALISNRRRLLITPTIIDNNMMSASPIEGKSASYFLYSMLSTIDFNTLVSGTALPYLNVSDLRKIPIVRPLDGVCRAFELKAASIFLMMQKLAAQSVTLASVRDALLPKLLSGEIEVSGLDEG